MTAGSPTLADVLIGTGAQVMRTTGHGVTEGITAPADLARETAGFTIDSRSVESGDVFFALKGDRSDGHDFVKDALDRGAWAAVVKEDFAGADLPSNRLLLRTNEPLRALQDLAKHWRTKHEVRVVGVTGSLGKTSVKEATAAAVSSLGADAVLKSEANLNTEIGLPLELLRLRANHKMAVLEMGMYQRGDIALLADIARPDIGIVTNVQANHMARTGSLEATARGKAELVHALPQGGVAVLNAADPAVRAMRFATRAGAVTYGPRDHGPADFTVSGARGLGRQGFTAGFRHGSVSFELHCPTPGAHHALNLLPALAVGHALGIGWQEMRESLSEFRMASRGRFIEGPAGSLVLDDTYNASAASVTAAIDLLVEEPGRHLALLGDMLELGAEEEQQHRAVGRRAAGLDGLILVGTRTHWIEEEAVGAGMSPEAIERVPDNERALEAARRRLGKGDVMLIKGSRGLRLDQVAEMLASDGVADGREAQ